MSLCDFIKNNWDKSGFMKISLNESLRSQIEDQTKFLDSYYENIPLRTRAYVILNGITENTIPKCGCGCQKPCAIDRTYVEKGFRSYATPECSRKSKTINNESKKKLEDYEWLYDQRIIQKKSIELIASELRVSITPVKKYLKSHGIDGLIDGRQRNTQGVIILSDYEALESLYDYVASIYSGEIIQSNRSVLNGSELDIYLPEKQLAIEYNGLYSHCHRPHESRESLIKGRNYHLKKTLMCKEKGIRLLQFFSDEWLTKRPIIESVIASKLGLNSRLYARKCSIEIIETHEKNMFLNENHVQGEDKSRIKLGLSHDGDLVGVMTFCKSRFSGDYEWELSRFACRRGVNIVGGFSKLLKEFRRSYGGSIISYADLRYSDGGVYYKNGFELIRTNSPSYYYVDGNYRTRHHRMKFQKRLIGADDSCTEYEHVRALGYHRIYDCGTLAFGVDGM
jgi:hypothetical protein